jgi:hypothetical protein
MNEPKKLKGEKVKDSRIEKWNTKIKGELRGYPALEICEKCPIFSDEMVYIYWEGNETDIKGRKLENNPCYKIGCELFKQANK